MRSNSTLTFLTLFAVLLSGCSLLNAPDRDQIIQDGGPADMRIADAGPDADVPTDAFDAGPELVEVCGDLEQEDEDGNGLSNCADFACVGFAGCCSMGTREPVNFLLEAAWTTSGAVQTRTMPNDVVFPDGLGTYMNTNCAPLAQGGVFEVDIEQDVAQTTNCDFDHERCDEFASVVLSSVTVAASDSPIVAEMGVRLYASGRAELYRGRDDPDDVISELDFDFTPQPITVIFQVTPDVVDGVGVLRAEATIRVNSMEVTLPETGVIPQSDLLRECGDGAGISGLYFGVEGRGSRLSVENNGASRRPLACTNPTQFQDTVLRPLVASDADSSQQSLDWRRDDWSLADVTHPELVREEVGEPPTSVWHVFGSTASRQLEFSALPDFPWTTAHSTTLVWNGMWTAQETPFRLDDAREPTAVDDGTDLVFVAIVDEVLSYCTLGVCTPIPIGECTEPANPSLVITEDSNYVLFFQCTDPVNGTVVRGQALSPRLLPNGLPFEVLRASDFGSLARSAIIDFDVLLDSRNATEHLVRAWFVGEALGNVRTLLLATGTIKLTDDPELTTLAAGFSLVPYPANPIATENVLFRDPDQSLQGVSVEHTGDPQNLRFLFGRRTERPEGRLYDFVPVEQTWGTL
ncbi:MAG: hypothetical protein AB8H86_27825 [Polyangiales bacterium]